MKRYYFEEVFQPIDKRENFSVLDNDGQGADRIIEHVFLEGFDEDKIEISKAPEPRFGILVKTEKSLWLVTVRWEDEENED